jgi:hypothetical protein
MTDQQNSHGFTEGERISFDFAPFSFWQRLGMWLRRPWAWPPKVAFDGEYTISKVEFNTFDFKVEKVPGPHFHIRSGHK